MQKKPQPASKAEPKFLHLIYYTNPISTRVVRIPLSRLNFLAAAAALLGLWTFVSTFLVVYLLIDQPDGKENQKIVVQKSDVVEVVTVNPPGVNQPRKTGRNQNENQKTSASEGVIIADRVLNNSQSKKEKSGANFREAYKKKRYAIKRRPIENPESVAELVEKLEKNGPQKTLHAKLIKKNPAVKSPESAMKDARIQVEKLKVEVQKSYLNVKFSIVNKKQIKIVKGAYYGVAIFLTDLGKNIKIESHNGAEIGEAISEFTHMPKFSVKRFVNKRIMFSKPKDVSGEFKSVKIYIKSFDGKTSIVESHIFND